MELDEADYVVIGSGSAGAIIASRLSEDPGRVLGRAADEVQYSSLYMSPASGRVAGSESAMRIVSFTEARNRLKSVLDGVAGDADVAVITRRDAEDAVVMSLDYYNSLMETVHLLKSPANAAHLAESIEQFRAGEVIERNTIDE